MLYLKCVSVWGGETGGRRQVGRNESDSLTGRGMRESNGNCWRHRSNSRSKPLAGPSTRAVIGLGAGTVKVHPFAGIAFVLALGG